MHAAHPFIAVWDDHEVEDNYADGEPELGPARPEQDQPQGLAAARPLRPAQANGYRAFFNYMPRMRFKGDRDRIFEDYRLGGLVDLMLTDERQYRDQQPCNDALLTPCPEAEAPRDLLGAKQKDWFSAPSRPRRRPGRSGRPS